METRLFKLVECFAKYLLIYHQQEKLSLNLVTRQDFARYFEVNP